MISRTSEIPDLNKYATKTLENDCFVDPEGSKLSLSYLLAVISEKMLASYVFPDKNQKPLRMCRMQISKQAVAILSLISGNVIIYSSRVVNYFRSACSVKRSFITMNYGALLICKSTIFNLFSTD